AAFQLFSDIGRLSGVVSRFRSDQLIRSERLKDWITALNSSQNFLKHADKDPDAVHNYSDESTILFISEAIELAGRVDQAAPREYRAFNIWFIASYPELIEPSFLEKFRTVDTRGLDQRDKSLWAEYLEVDE